MGESSFDKDFLMLKKFEGRFLPKHAKNHDNPLWYKQFKSYKQKKHVADFAKYNLKWVSQDQFWSNCSLLGSTCFAGIF